ncbi:hypothetical protein Aeqsu_2554 [Aequorivita sublithincola DSM 14238]|uniref:Uncharacterized protein n=2 Tax=Aequorivita TaxID=153265 RepID=I3YYE2_AEQSU|nr:hypothetical protein Aeqsu_2554 [Aequorivita sublithincola DSM 14238]
MYLSETKVRIFCTTFYSQNSHHPMKVLVENIEILPQIVQVPVMNFGQMQRWQDFVELNYSIELTTELFIEKISTFFAEFRDAEIKDDDPFDFPELISFKDVEWSDLNVLIKK